MAECLECGEPATIMHPEYSAGDYGDKLCEGCYGQYCEQQIEYWVEQLVDHINETEYTTYNTTWNLEDYTDDN